MRSSCRWSPSASSASKPYDEFDVAWQLSAERGWMVPAYTLPPNAEDVKVMRALVKETLSRAQVDHLASDIKEACATLEKKGGAHGVRAPPGQDRHRVLSLTAPSASKICVDRSDCWRIGSPGEQSFE